MDSTRPPCPVCRTPNPVDALACRGCGAALAADAPPSGGHRTLVGLPGIAASGPEATLLGLGPPRFAPPAPRVEPAEETLLGPPQPAGLATDALDGATLLESFAPLRVAAEPPSQAPLHVLAAEQDAIDLEEEPDAPLPAVRGPAATLRTAELGARAEAATQRIARPGRWRPAALFLGVAVAAGLLAAVLLVALRDDFRAELAGDLSVTRTSSGYLVQVGVRTSGPARVTWPGGRSAVDGEATLRFELERGATHLGDNRITLDVSPGSGRDRTLTVHVLVHYEWHGLLDEPGGPVAGLRVQPGWSVELASPGRVEKRRDGEVRLFLAAPLPPAVRFLLRSPTGETLTFDEPLRRPSP